MKNIYRFSIVAAICMMAFTGMLHADQSIQPDYTYEEWINHHGWYLGGTGADCKDVSLDVLARGIGWTIEKIGNPAVTSVVLNWTGSKLLAIACGQLTGYLGAQFAQWGSWTCWCKPATLSSYVTEYDGINQTSTAYLELKRIECCEHVPVHISNVLNASCSSPTQGIVSCLQAILNAQSTCFRQNHP